MRWQIVWIDAAIADVARHYLRGLSESQATAVTSAMAVVDQILIASADTAGESREGNARVIIVPPLVVRFESDADQRIAVVVKVLYRPNRRAG
jgi:hypothetical protein